MKIFVKSKPGSSEELVEKINNNHFVVWVKEQPIKGLANRAIVRALAQYFNIAPSLVSLVKGFTSRQKIFEISTE